MYSKPDDFSEYREYSVPSQEIDYAHPQFYQQPDEQAQSAQHAERYDTKLDYAGYSAVPVSTADVEQVQAYRGPQNLEGYTKDVGATQREAAKNGSAEGGKRKKVAGLGGIAVMVGGFLAKFSFLLKFGVLGFSALLSVIVYSLLFGWAFAVGLVALLFIHELGHAVVMKLKGLPVGGMVFIPFLGAAVSMRQMPQNAKDEAEVGIAGPIAGTIASSVCLLIAQMHQNMPSIWAPLAYFGFFLNLFNLIPIVPFDGGRVLAAIDRRIWIVGFLLLLGYQIWSWFTGNFSIWLLFFVVLAATQLWSRGLAPSTPASRAYYTVPVGTRIALTVLYFGLAAVLFLGMSSAHALMPLVQ